MPDDVADPAASPPASPAAEPAPAPGSVVGPAPGSAPARRPSRVRAACARPEAEPPSRRAGRFLVLLGALTGLHVAWGLARGTLVPTVQGVLLAPALLASAAWLGLGAAASARDGRWGLGLVPVLLLVALAAYLGSGALARRMMFPGCRVPLGPPQPGAPADAPRVVVDYAAEDGVALRGLLVRGLGAAPRPALVYFHGNAESAATNVDVAALFAARGLDVFLAEYRGYGGCPGSPTEEGLLADARAAVRVASERTGVAPRDLVLFGRSIGSGVAAAMTGEGHGRALVLLSPYTSILELASRLVPAPLAAFAVRDTFDSRARLAPASQPVLVLHGTQDEVIPYDLGRDLAASLGARARLVTLEGCGHNDVFLREAGRIVEETVALARTH